MTASLHINYINSVPTYCFKGCGKTFRFVVFFDYLKHTSTTNPFVYVTSLHKHSCFPLCLSTLVFPAFHLYPLVNSITFVFKFLVRSALDEKLSKIKFTNPANRIESSNPVTCRPFTKSFTYIDPCMPMPIEWVLRKCLVL